jgi:hypothetical protein
MQDNQVIIAQTAQHTGTKDMDLDAAGRRVHDVGVESLAAGKPKRRQEGPHKPRPTKYPILYNSDQSRMNFHKC